MSASKSRKCKFVGGCIDQAAGKRRVNGVETFLCADHIAVIAGARIEARGNGTEARQAAEAATATVDDAAAKALRVKAEAHPLFVAAVWQTITAEEYAGLELSTRRVARRSNVDAGMMSAQARQDVEDAFVTRVADEALNRFGADADPREAVTADGMAEFRAHAVRSVAYVNATRKGMHAGRSESIDAATGETFGDNTRSAFDARPRVTGLDWADRRAADDAHGSQTGRAFRAAGQTVTPGDVRELAEYFAEYGDTEHIRRTARETLRDMAPAV